MGSKIVVAYDGSDSGKRAVDFAVNLAKSQGSSLVVAHVLEWSPYSFLTPTEIEERHTRRKEELARANDALIAPLIASLEGSGLEISSSIKYGHIAETLCTIATESGASQVVIGRTGHSNMSARLFGSVATSLAQASPVPVTVVP
ncbi:MAG: universal stress protein [Rhodobacteraceae bacterium]|nr:universal stress protein [Paracoccaceae bacterium]